MNIFFNTRFQASAFQNTDRAAISQNDSLQVLGDAVVFTSQLLWTATKAAAAIHMAYKPREKFLSENQVYEAEERALLNNLRQKPQDPVLLCHKQEVEIKRIQGFAKEIFSHVVGFSAFWVFKHQVTESTGMADAGDVAGLLAGYVVYDIVNSVSRILSRT